ncbi:MAG: ABC transporter permease [Oscillospiraceae bacterium]
MLVIEILVLLIMPLIYNIDPNYLDFANFAIAPCKEHILGTDEVGRDILARILSGGKTSLSVGLISTVISVVIGVPLGLLAGYYRGIIETVVMRAIDMFISFPAMILILVIVAIVEPSVTTVTVVIGILGWTQPAKLVYSRVLSVSKEEYVEAARSIGCSDFTVLMKYVLPNSVAPLWTSIPFRISHAIIMESSLSFLGAGVKPPQASWGNIIYAAQSMQVLTEMPWIWIPASICLLLTIICINLVGEGIRDAMDPKMKC